MLTVCPKCQTTFRVSQAQLDAAQGKVRCGKCQKVFNAAEHVSQPTEIEETAKTSVKKSPTPTATPPPQIDWLQHNDKDDVDHIELDHSFDETDNQADIEVTESAPEFNKDQFEAKSFKSDANNHEYISIEVPEDFEPKPATKIDEDDEVFNIESSEEEDPVNDVLDEAISIETADDNTDHHHLANKAPIIPNDQKASLLDNEEDQTLPGIGPAYEDDTQLNYRDEQGLDDIQDEIKRQLQSPAQDDANVEEDAFDSVLGYIEDVQQDVKAPAEKTTAFENIELNSVPEPDDGNTVNWNHDVHLDPEVPAALRSSMQALQKKKRLPLLTAFMSVVLFVLIVDLGLQTIVFRSYDIVTKWPQTRSILAGVCEYLPCVYSGRREPRKIQLVNRDVRVHPSAKHALLISATVVNQSGHAQPYPRLAIKLSDLSGDVIAEREFAPQEYLKDSESKLKLLRPDVPTLITLEVLDPGSEAVNFEFRFL